MLVGQGQKMIAKCADHAASAKEPLGAANALWTLVRIGHARGQNCPGCRCEVLRREGAASGDFNCCAASRSPKRPAFASKLSEDTDPAVRVEAALSPRRVGSGSLSAARCAAAWRGRGRSSALRGRLAPCPSCRPRDTFRGADEVGEGQPTPGRAYPRSTWPVTRISPRSRMPWKLSHAHSKSRHNPRPSTTC